LRPFRGIPEARNLPRFDLLYLDENGVVIKGTELFSVHEFAAFGGRVASALALPPKTISRTQTVAGDQLKVASAEDEEMAQWLASADAPVTPGIAAAVNTQQLPDEGAVSGESADAHQSAQKGSLLQRFRKWLDGDKETKTWRADRRALPGLIAYYWTGGAPQSYQLANISLTGLYLLTDERWVIETVIQMRLQRTDKQEYEAGGSIPVLVKVARWGVDGVGLQFVFPEPGTQQKATSMAGTNLEDLVHFLHGLESGSGGN